jgi:alpha-tubulin suppressor-like RCC1 family protein
LKRQLSLIFIDNLLFSSSVLPGKRSRFTLGGADVHCAYGFEQPGIHESFSDQSAINSINFSLIALGQRHTVVVDEDGKGCGLGWNDEGQIGQPTSNHYPSPTPIPLLTRYKIAMISCGASHTLVVDQSGSLFAMGRNNWGQLGLGHSRNVQSPARVTGGGVARARIRRVVCGDDYSFVLCEAKEAESPSKLAALSAGKNCNGQCAQPDKRLFREFTLINSNSLLKGEKFGGLVDIVCGENHTFMIGLSGSVCSVGCNENGQLGRGTRGDSHWIKDDCNDVFNLSLRVVQVACGAHHTLAILQNGSVWGTGSNWRGQLGMGDNMVGSLHCLTYCGGSLHL